MKQASPELVAFLNSSRHFVMADLYEITLRNGDVVRWSGADVPLNVNEQTYSLGPVIERGTTSVRRGVEVDTLELTVFSNGGSYTINDVPLIPFIRRAGFDGATFKLKRVFGGSWSNLVGDVTIFAGRFTDIKDASRTQATIEVASWLELLNVQMPPNLVQAGCLHTLFDNGCMLNKLDWEETGTVTASDTNTSFDTDLPQAAAYFDQGTIEFTSGANTGVIRTVRSQYSSGIVNVILALPGVPQVGDTFKIYPGCDRTQATCSSKFSNLPHFRGFPYVPTVETSL
jgi:uncharacterized phage protein (TIGR02218 family)